MTDRDTFAAAALTGLLAAPTDKDRSWDYWARLAYEAADAMLARCPKNGTGSGFEAGPDPDSRTWETYPSNHPAPPCVETDGFSSGSRTGQINRTPERESPRRECEESSLRDDTHPDTKGRATGGPEHHISKAEIDALQHVVEDGQIVKMWDYARLRRLLIRLRPEWEDQPYEKSDEKRGDSNMLDRLAALERLSALDQELERTHGVRHTQAECTKQDEGSVPVSRNRNDPVAWAVISHAGAYDSSFGDRSDAEDWRAELMAEEGREYFVAPLFRDLPALTDAEREAIEGAIASEHQRGAWQWADTLRALMVRLG